MSQNTSKGSKKPATSKKNDIPKKDDAHKMVPLTVNVAPDILEATANYRRKFGFPSDQDVIRLGLARFLSQEGFLKI